MSTTERAALCDTALLVGADRPTLCEGWEVKDLVVHLLLREGSLTATAGLFIPPLSGLNERATRKLSQQEFTVLVERLRGGPPVYSPLAIPPVEALVNSVEFFVHHEDVRRAQPGWEPRELPSWQQNLLWKQVALIGRRSARRSGVGVRVVRGDTAEQRGLANGEPMVVVRGLPSEITLFLFGRKAKAVVELEGAADAVEKLRGAPMGI
jgi:uncharacterized protein (TIGR03085 family)